MSNSSNSDSIHHDTLPILTFADFSKCSNFDSTRRGVLHFVTIEVWCYASVVSDYSHSFNVNLFQLITL